MAELILPGQAPRRRATNLYLPGSVIDAERKAQPRPVVFSCEICGETFPHHAGGAWETHVGRCAREHEGAIAEMVKERRASPLHEAYWDDPEIAEHMTALGKKMRREGRFIVHPHERAGF